MSQKFYTVYRFSEGQTEWVLLGAFSKEEDRNAYFDEELSKEKKGLVAPAIMSIETIKANLLQERLGKLHDVLLRLETQSMTDTLRK